LSSFKIGGKTNPATLSASGLTAARTLTLPDRTDTLATLAGAEQLANKELKAQSATFVDKGNSGTSAQTLDYSAGNVQRVAATGNHTISISNWPASGKLGVMLLWLENGGSYTVTLPSANYEKPDGTTTTSVSTWLAAMTGGRSALQSSGIDKIVYLTTDGGSNVYARFW
jgi:hypothetical protein